MAKYTSHPKNVSGDFYVEDRCCTLCGVPLATAPELFGEARDDKGLVNCYVKRQPINPGEIHAMIDVIEAAELACIRYKGKDNEIQLKLVKIGESAQCDDLLEE